MVAIPGDDGPVTTPVANARRETVKTLALILGLVVGTITLITFIWYVASYFVTLEGRVRTLEDRVHIPDPVAQRCADLAGRLAHAGDPGIDVFTIGAAKHTQSVMADLNCRGLKK